MIFLFDGDESAPGKYQFLCRNLRRCDFLHIFMFRTSPNSFIFISECVIKKRKKRFYTLIHKSRREETIFMNYSSCNFVSSLVLSYIESSRKHQIQIFAQLSCIHYKCLHYKRYMCVPSTLYTLYVYENSSLLTGTHSHFIQ